MTATWALDPLVEANRSHRRYCSKRKKKRKAIACKGAKIERAIKAQKRKKAKGR